MDTILDMYYNYKQFFITHYSDLYLIKAEYNIILKIKSNYRYPYRDIFLGIDGKDTIYVDVNHCNLKRFTWDFQQFDKITGMVWHQVR